MARQIGVGTRTDHSIMISFVGSNYQYTGENPTGPDLVYIQDHHYNEDLQCFPVQKLLENSQYSHTVLFDHVVQHDDVLKNYDLVCLPIFAAKSCDQFNNQGIQVSWDHRPYTFNFMINKPRLHREFLLLLIEHFALSDYAYTLCWKKSEINRDSLIALTDNSQYHDIIGSTPMNIPSRQFLLGQENLLDRGLQYRHITNSENYQAFLQKNVFEPSCISLITEPAFFEQETIITEKTIMAIWGGTVPIWVGGWRIADYMRSMGFDTFDDVVDHSYQDLADPVDRCYQAIQLNLSLLQDHDLAHNIILQSQSRLQHNLDLLHQNCFRQQILKQLTTLDSTVANLVKNIVG